MREPEWVGAGRVPIEFDDGQGGTIDVDAVQTLNNIADPASVINVTTGGLLKIRTELNDRPGTGILNIDGGTVQFSTASRPAFVRPRS